MRFTLIGITALLLVASCSSPDASSELAKKKIERDSLRTALDDLSSKLLEVEEWIASNDTAVLKKLPLVTTTLFNFSPYEHYVELHGTVKADQNALLYSAMGGEIKSIKVKQGSKVRKGDRLVSIDAASLQSNIRQMQTQLTLATDVYERQQKLWKEQGIGSEVQYLEAKANKESLEASLASMRAQLRASQIYAPFNGVVDEIFPRVGDMASPMNPVLRLVALGKSSIEADVAEEYLGVLKEGDPVQVMIESGDTLLATVDQIGSFINPGNRTFKINCRVSDGTPLRPNQLTTIRIRDMVKDSAFVLSPRLIMEDSNGDSYIYVLNESGKIPAAKKIMVNRIRSSSDKVLIQGTEMLKPGDLIIDQGSRLVVNEQNVRVRES